MRKGGEDDKEGKGKEWRIMRDERGRKDRQEDEGRR